eukprot:4247422-Pleurochrysis_carterae.AAC.2
MLEMLVLYQRPPATFRQTWHRSVRLARRARDEFTQQTQIYRQHWCSAHAGNAPVERAGSGCSKMSAQARGELRTRPRAHTRTRTRTRAPWTRGRRARTVLLRDRLEALLVDVGGDAHKL